MQHRFAAPRSRKGSLVVWLSLVSLSLFAGGCGGEQGSAQKAATRPALTIADTGATTNPPAELPMDVQHHTMDEVQENYGTVIKALAGKNKADAAKGAREVAGLADRIPVFMIHKPDVQPDSLKAWARILKGQALRVAQLSDTDSLTQAQDLAARMSGTCSKCHDMYGGKMPEAGEMADHDHDAKPAKAAKKTK